MIAEKHKLSKIDAEQFKKLFAEDELENARLFVIDNTYQSELDFISLLGTMMPPESYDNWDYHHDLYTDPNDPDYGGYSREIYTDEEMLDKHGFGGVIERFYKSNSNYSYETHKHYVAIHNDNFIESEQIK